MLVFQGDEEESEDDADYAPDAPGGSDAESSSDSDEDDGDEDSDDGERKKSKTRPASGSAKKGASKKQVGYLCSSYIPLVCSGPVQYTSSRRVFVLRHVQSGALTRYFRGGCLALRENVDPVI